MSQSTKPFKNRILAAKRRDAVKEVARKSLGINHLEARNMDSLDFKEYAVWEIEQALADAYDAGRLAAIAERDKESK